MYKVNNNKTQKKNNIFFSFCLILDQGQSSARELKNENHFLKDYIHRLNVAASEYQILHPPDVLKTDMKVWRNLVCDINCVIRSTGFRFYN
jgi:hypothetical protein